MCSDLELPLMRAATTAARHGEDKPRCGGVASRGRPAGGVPAARCTTDNAMTTRRPPTRAATGSGVQRGADGRPTGPPRRGMEAEPSRFGRVARATTARAAAAAEGGPVDAGRRRGGPTTEPSIATRRCMGHAAGWQCEAGEQSGGRDERGMDAEPRPTPEKKKAAGRGRQPCCEAARIDEKARRGAVRTAGEHRIRRASMARRMPRADRCR